MPTLFFLHELGLRKNENKFIDRIIIVSKPPGKGMPYTHKIMLVKYFFWDAKRPISFCSIVPKNTKTINQIMVNTNILGSEILLINLFIFVLGNMQKICQL